MDRIILFPDIKTHTGMEVHKCTLFGKIFNVVPGGFSLQHMTELDYVAWQLSQKPNIIRHVARYLKLQKILSK